jgi:hypothetical protein
MSVAARRVEVNRASVERQVGELLKAHPPQGRMGERIVLPRFAQAPLVTLCGTVEHLLENGDHVQHG